jgi:flagellar hook protein FlgE
MFSTPNTLGGGAGVRVDNTQALHTQGALEYTSNDTDFAINGSGFFILSDGTSTYYTRAGNFQVGQDGTVVSQDGKQLQGYTADSPDTLAALDVGNVAITPTPTSNVELRGNLDVSADVAAIPGTIATFQELNAASEFNTSVEIIDSLGERHDVGLHFFHTGQNEWTVRAYVDAEETGGTAGTLQLLQESRITTDAEGQQADDAAVLTLNAPWGNGAAASDVTIDTSGFTGFANASNVSSIESDGLRAGNVVGIELAPDGTLSGVLDNGSSTVIGTVALAKFTNPTSLDKIGGNQFVASNESSEASIGTAGTEGRGTLSGGALESANIDASKEFTDIIRYQRGYQGSSQAFQTANELISTTLQMA